MPHSICSIPECDKKAHSRGWCSGHYRRWHLTGNPIIRCQGCDSALPLQYGAQKYCSPECRPRCEVADCDRPQRKMKWCEKHHARWGRTGDPVKVTHVWVDKWECIVCGKPVEKGSGRRSHCSSKCQVLSSTYGRNVPRVATCTVCLSEIDLFETNYNGRKRRGDVLMCRGCRQADGRSWRRHLDAILDRDKNMCGICHQTIDLTLTFPNIMRASVDHIIPRSQGGSDDIANLQPAHLSCNARRQDKPLIA